MVNLPELVKTARKRLLRMHYARRVGHLGGNLSALDILMTLFHRAMRPEDMFILSKGHAAGALYVALWSLGHLSDDDLNTFHGDGTRLSGHPSPHWCREIPFATGSLGHGLSLACGVALGKALQNQPGRIFCLLSDGEFQEGSTWEAIIFANRHRLAPLTILIDNNGLQGFGNTRDVSGLELSMAKFREFGLSVEEIDGHDLAAIAAACNRTTPSIHVVIANTCKGHGVSYMENQMEWHYLPMNEDQYQQALREVDDA